MVERSHGAQWYDVARTMKVEDRGEADPSLPMLVVRSSDGAKLPNEVVRSMELSRLSPASPPCCRAISAARCRFMCLHSTSVRCGWSMIER